jgi:hypothetical protein
MTRGGNGWGHRGISMAVFRKTGWRGGHHVRDAGMLRDPSTGFVPRRLLHDLCAGIMLVVSSPMWGATDSGTM